MAKQRSLYKIQGTLGDFTFVKTENGYEVREKSSLTGDRIATDPSFQRTRENNAEFSNATKASKMLRDAVRTLLQNAKDSKTANRLTSEMFRVIHADTTSARGFRNVIDGDLSLLQGFDFNTNGKLGQSLYAPFTTTVDRVTGKLDVGLDPYTPVNAIGAPIGTTHYKIVSMGAEVDFATGIHVTDEQVSALLPYDATATAALTLSNTVSANSTKPLFLLLGVQYFQDVNGASYQLKNGVFNALNVVKVDVV